MSAETRERRFARGDYWIISSVVVHRYPFYVLAQADVEERFGMPTHGMSTSRLASVLGELATSGLIRAWVREKQVTPTASAIEDYLKQARGPDTAYYGLTEQGGAVWERFARPEWSKFILEVRPDNCAEPQGWNATCQDEGWLREYCRLRERVLGGLEPNSTTFRAIGEWSPTYWKRLPNGYQAEGRSRDYPKHYPDKLMREDRWGRYAVSYHKHMWCRWL